MMIFQQRLRKGGIKIKKDAVVTVQNIVSSINLGGKVHLEKAAGTFTKMESTSVNPHAHD